MFKLGETHYTKNGYAARIICVDAQIIQNGKVCSVVALIDVPATLSASKQVVYYYSPDGKYAGLGNNNYDLLSNEPNEEEQALIAQMLDLAEGSVERKEEALLKVIRQLRKK